MTEILKIFLIYVVAVNAFAAVLTIADKIKARHNKWRISESALLLIGLIGGALGEYVTMKAIRHKTLHKKFMLGLPAEIILHIIIIAFVFYKYFY